MRLILALFTAVALAGPVAAAPIAAVSFSSANAYSINAGGHQTDGFSFTTIQSITIDSLGAFAPPAGGIPVRLYNSVGTTLASTTVLPGDPAGTYSQAGNFFRFHAITPVTLAAGQTFFLTADEVPGNTILGNAVGLTTNPAISFGSVVSGGTGTNPLSDTFGYGGFTGNNRSLFGPNFTIAPVPEPATLVVFGGLALAGAMGYRRRKG